MAFAVAHIEKIETPGKLARKAAHNARSHDIPNVDASRRLSNRAWETFDADPGAVVDAKIRELAGPKLRLRKDSVKAAEITLSASPEYFRPEDPRRAGYWHEDRLEAWVTASRAWLEHTFGNRIVDCRLHLDETTPHIQAIFVPMTKDGRLSAKEFIGRQALLSVQKTYGESVAHLGIERGIRGSKAKHDDIKAYYGAIDQEVNAFLELQPPTPMDAIQPRKYIERETQRLKEALQPQASRAANAINERRRREDALREQRNSDRRAIEFFDARETALKERDEALRRARMAEDEAKRLRKESTDRLRALDLADVADRLGLTPDPADKNQWRGDGMRISFTGSKFYDHDAGKGGGGAIDFAAHVLRCKVGEAIAWLSREFGQGAVEATAMRQVRVAVERNEPPPFIVPEHQPSLWDTVRSWLTTVRKVSVEIVDRLRNSEHIGADARGNFVAMMGNPRKPRGAELKGTGQRSFTGLARGSSRSAVFAISADGKPTDIKAARHIVLCESAIDAMSYANLNPQPNTLICSTAGVVRKLPGSLVSEIEKGSRFTIAFDADDPGREAALALATWISERGGKASVELPDSGKDWNDVLRRRYGPEGTATGWVDGKGKFRTFADLGVVCGRGRKPTLADMVCRTLIEIRL